MCKEAAKVWNNESELSVRHRNHRARYSLAPVILAVLGTLFVVSCNNTSLLTEVKAEVEQAKGAQTVATPTFNPQPGSFTSDQSVAMSDATPGATIYYTTNGSAPSEASSVYSSPITVAGNGTTMTIQAMATKSGMKNSAAASGTFTINGTRVSTPQFNPNPGTFAGDQYVKISDATPNALIYFTTDGSTPTTSSTVYGGSLVQSGIAVSGPVTTLTIQALATAPGLDPSTVATGIYTVLYQYSLTFSVNNAAYGTISAPAASPTTVNHGAPTTITATPNTGYSFVSWTVSSGNGVSISNPSSPSTTVTLTAGNASIVANFAPVQYTLTVQDDGNCSVTPSGPQTVGYGVATNISCTPNTNYGFSHWAKTAGSGTATFANAYSASTTVTLTGGSATIQATCTNIQYQLSVVAGPGGRITAPSSSPQTVFSGAGTTITATPDSGYVFVNWTTAGSGVSFADANSASTTVTLTSGNATVTANFGVLLTVNAGSGGTITTPSPSPVTVVVGVATSITASPSAGNSFVSWTQAGGPGTASFGNANSASTMVTVTGGNATILASFAAQLTVNAGSGGTITTPSSPTTVTLGSPTTITASPNGANTFVSWTQVGGSGTASFGNANSASTTVTLSGAAATVQANFGALLTVTPVRGVPSPRPPPVRQR